MSDFEAPDLESLRNKHVADDFIGDFDVTLDDLPPLDDGLDGTTIGDGVCESCGGPTFRPPGLTPSGSKKRVPKRCDSCRKNVSVSSPGSSTKGMESQLRRVQEELADDVRLLAMMAGTIMPVTGYYLTVQADPFVTAILKLCKNNQRMLRVLHRAAQVAPIYTVAETLAGTAWATQVDLKGADPHNMISRRLGVEAAYEEVHGQQPLEPTYNFQSAPRY
jgi:hypothetical protein